MPRWSIPSLALSLPLLLVGGCVSDPSTSKTTGETGTEPTTVPEQPPADQDQDGFTEDVDCDDGDPAVYPGALEICGDGVLTDCDGLGDEGHVTVDGVGYYDDLQQALDEAAPGAEVLVCGRHAGAFVAPVAVRLVGAEGLWNVLDGEDAGTTLVVPGGTELRDLTIEGGAGDVGGGIRQSEPGTIVLQSTFVEGNRARVGAGVALAEGGALSLVASTIVGNVADEGGGGVWAPAGAEVALDAVSLVSGNSAGWGGGVWLEDATLRGGTVEDNHVSIAEPIVLAGGVVGNTGPVGGGGVAASGVSAVEGTRILSNTSVGSGGGVSAFGSTLVLTDVLVQNATAVEYGGGLLALDSAVVLAGTSELFVGSADAGGGGAAVFGGSLVGGAVVQGHTLVSGSGLYLEHAEVEGTSVTQCGDPGAAVQVAQQATLQDVSIELNSTTALSASPTSAVDPLAVPGVLLLIGGGVLDNSAAGVGGVVAGLTTVVSGTAFEGNTGSGAAAIEVTAPVSLTGGSVRDNRETSGQGAAIVLSGAGSLAVDLVDFGVTSVENQPADVLAGSTPYDWIGLKSMTCTVDGCSPLP